MNDMQEAADLVKNVSRTFKAVIALSEAIEKHQGFDQYESEVNARLAAAKGKSAELDGLLAQIEEAKAGYKQVLELTAKTGEHAKAEGDAVLAEAQEHAQVIRDTAHKYQDAALGRIRYAEDKLEGVLKALSEREGELKALEKKIAAVKADALKALEA